MVDEKKLYRITFSQSLAEKLAKETNKICRSIKLVIGDRVSLDSDIKLYAICKKKSGWPLRVTLFKEAAEMWRSDSTEIRECKIKL